MALSLEFLGKWILIVIAIMVAVGLIVSFRGDAKGSVGNIAPGDEEEGATVVTVDGDRQQKADKVAELVDQCNTRSLQRGHEDFDCFLAKNEDGFQISREDITQYLEPEVEERTKFEAESYDGDLIVIRYSFSDDKVVLN